jgi:hypothetical protein
VRNSRIGIAKVKTNRDRPRRAASSNQPSRVAAKPSATIPNTGARMSTA